MKRVILSLIVLLVCLMAGHQPVSAQEDASGSETESPSDWTVEDVINQERAGDLNFSPDGNSLVWTRSHPDREKDGTDRDLYLTRLDVKDEKGNFKAVQLTRGSESDYSPFFSKDGETIYFLSSREEGNKLWAMSVYGGEPRPVHTFETGISDVQWMGERKLAFVSNDGKTLYERELEQAEDNTVVVEDTAHFKPSRVYSFDLDSKEVRRLTENEYPVSEYQVSSDGKWMVTTHILSPHYGADADPRPKHYLWNLQDGGRKEILAEGYQTPGNFEFDGSNNGFYFVSVQSSDPQWRGAGITLLHYYDLEKGSPRQVPLDWEWGLGSGFDLVGDDLFVGLANGATVKLAWLEKTGSGWDRKAVDAGERDEHISVTAVGKNNQKVAYVWSTASDPPEYRVADLRAGRRQVTVPEGEELFRLNTHLEGKTMARTEVVKWEGALDDTITGILYYPHNYREGRSYPLVVTIHGGPSGVDTDSWGESWTDFNNIMAQKGAFVLQPNYHGSSNHGQEFVESIKGHYYEYELPDIVAGVEMLVGQGKVDPDSLGVKGWSNGAILTTMLTVRHPDMFKVAAPGAGDVNWTSDYGTCAFGVSFDQSYFGGAPWDNTDGEIFNSAYIQKSPLFEMEKVRTPTIIFHGSEDRAVPRDQGWEYYRALQQVGQAPVRFLWFPNQPHGLRKITHQTRKIKEEIRWFDKYLFGTHRSENEAFKEGSPLAEMLKKDKVARSGGLYGETVNGTLVPETVPVAQDSIAVGRFEVTNAQYGEYRPHDYPASRANHPVTGLTAGDAEEYLRWLSELTGEDYRLPSGEEAKRLHKQAKKSAAAENTLNWWAGYELTLYDVAELRKKLEELEGSLLKEAGSYKSVEVGNTFVYDLGGNAAELAEGGGSYGYSAVSFVDEREEEAGIAPPAYTGFRVIKH